MRIDEQGAPEAVLQELGQRLARRRLETGLSQDEVARRAGVGKRTLERMEGGADCQVSTLLRVLRVLGLMDGVEGLAPDVAQRPMDLLEGRRRERKRAPRKPPVAAPREAWRWGDEE